MSRVIILLYHISSSKVIFFTIDVVFYLCVCVFNLVDLAVSSRIRSAVQAGHVQLLELGERLDGLMQPLSTI